MHAVGHAQRFKVRVQRPTAGDVEEHSSPTPTIARTVQLNDSAPIRVKFRICCPDLPAFSNIPLDDLLEEVTGGGGRSQEWISKKGIYSP